MLYRILLTLTLSQVSMQLQANSETDKEQIGKALVRILELTVTTGYMCTDAISNKSLTLDQINNECMKHQTMLGQFAKSAHMYRPPESLDLMTEEQQKKTAVLYKELMERMDVIQAFYKPET